MKPTVRAYEYAKSQARVEKQFERPVQERCDSCGAEIEEGKAEQWGYGASTLTLCPDCI